MRVGDKIKIHNRKAGYDGEKNLYTLLEIGDTWVKVEHPEIPGYFIFSKDLVEGNNE